MALVIHVGGAHESWWLEHLQSLLPEIECRLWHDAGDPADILYAVVWRPPAGGLKQFPNLRCIVSVGAGIDHVLADPELPRAIPIIRTTGDELTQRMREYVCLQVLRQHRRVWELEEAERARRWRQTVNPPAYERRVGVMGLGRLGGDAARALAGIGFDVAGWARREKRIAGVTCFAAGALDDFLRRTEILVCLLPLTPTTEGILDRRLFAGLPKGACLVNVGRGRHLVEKDLIPALDSGQLGGATLDVLQTEPPPDDHPFWRHPKILLTPHIASLIDPETGAKVIAENLKRFMAGQPVADIVDLNQGY